MVITCPACSARYRLNPQKIAGRGAKITCPKCAHVFVVFTEAADKQEDAADTLRRPTSAPPPPRGSVPPRPSDPSDDGAFDDRPEAAEASNSSIRVVAPGSRHRRTTGSFKVFNPGDEATSSGRSAADLDFREVGISTWKVKVAIGLVYDFSDIGTLKKYLAEKKVTPEDLVSHDGKAWKKIAEINDLDQHFIDVWERAKAIEEGTPLPESVGSATDKTPVTEATAPASSSLANPTSSMSGTGEIRMPGASRSSASKRKRRPPKKEEESSGSKSGLILIALLVALVGVALYAMRGGDGGGAKVGDATPVVAPPEASSDDEASRIQAQIEEDLKKQREELAQQMKDAEPEEEEEGGGELDTSKLIPVGPHGASTTGRRVPPAERKTPTRMTVRPTPTPRPASTGSVTTARSSNPYKKMCDKKFAAKDFGSAVKACQKALDKDPRCSTCRQKLNDAKAALGGN